jgi:septum formation protein
MRKLILASQSPRRKELLERAGFLFSVHSIQISEIPNENLSLSEQIEDLARQKALALVDSGNYPKTNGILLLSADTLVILEGQVLGKPKDLVQSREFLKNLSGRRHSVITGLCFLDLETKTLKVAHEESFVKFNELSEDQISRYVASRDGMDKAGAYGIQTLEKGFIEKIEGNIDNVMGLPVGLVEKILAENNWYVDRRKS